MYVFVIMDNIMVVDDERDEDLHAEDSNLMACRARLLAVRAGLGPNS
jgi:hypothetical protein